MPVKEIGEFQKRFRPYIIGRPQLKAVAELPDKDFKLCIMQESLASDADFVDYMN